MTVKSAQIVHVSDFKVNNIKFPTTSFSAALPGPKLSLNLTKIQYCTVLIVRLQRRSNTTCDTIRRKAPLAMTVRSRQRQAGRPGPRSLPACRTVGDRASPRPRLRCVSPCSEGDPRTIARRLRTLSQRGEPSIITRLPRSGQRGLDTRVQEWHK
jgi:hypothetical protein